MLNEKDVQSLENLVSDMVSGKFKDIDKYNLSEDAVDFLALTMRKALCPNHHQI